MSFTQQILSDDLINSVYEKNDIRFWKCYFAKWERIYDKGCNTLLKKTPVVHTSDYKWSEMVKPVSQPVEGTIMQVTHQHYGIQKIYEVLAHEEFDCHPVSDKMKDETCDISRILMAATRLSYEWFDEFYENYFDNHGSLPTVKTFGESFMTFLNEFKSNRDFEKNIDIAHEQRN